MTLTSVVALLPRSSLFEDRSQLLVERQHLIVIHRDGFCDRRCVIITVFLVIIFLVRLLGFLPIDSRIPVCHSSDLKRLGHPSPEFGVHLLIIVFIIIIGIVI
jgi:hypothetical protein